MFLFSWGIREKFPRRSATSGAKAYLGVRHRAFLAAGNYPWTVIRVEQRAQYMTALETASVKRDISEFTRFIVSEMEASTKRAD